jgi:DNA polymerase III subunit alpha
VNPRFIHLHVHSEYALVDSVIRLKALVKAVAAAEMPAVAVTDPVNLFGLVRFYKAALGTGIKPIVGADVWVRNPDDLKQPHRLVLLVQNQRGYGNLTRLISRAYLEGQHPGCPLPQVDLDWIEAAAPGLIALSGGAGGDVAQALCNGRPEIAERLLDRWLALFGDRYYLELIRTGRETEETVVELSVALAQRRGVPVVATNDVRFLAASDFEAHEARVCIHDGTTLNDARRPHRYSAEQYLRTPAEMCDLFADLPEALENSVEIAKRCTLELTLGKNYLPDFPVPAGLTINSFFSEQAQFGLEKRLAHIFNPAAPEFNAQRQHYDARLALELQVIIQMGFPGYFLIVADFIQWAKDHNIPVGPGRGSGAGSLVAYALKITDLDPIEHELLFERFLNPERVSMPDFDVDFCMEGRDEVIQYVADKYGRDAVSQIITFGTMAAKAVVRDVGRVMGHPYGFVDRIAKMVPFELGMTLEKALAEGELKQAYQTDEEVRTLIDLARQLEGLTRNAGKHAGGVVIAPTQLTDFAPLYCEPGGVNLVTQFDKDDVEKVGLVKFDFLGLRTLTIIKWALKTINDRRAGVGEPAIVIEQIDPQDRKAFELLKQCQTTAVFQLESRGMKELIKKLQPDCFNDITALVALFRPGPLQSGMVDDFINRKHGRADVAYPHPELEPVLKPTYGIILYQEQVMQIAQVLAGYSLGSADILRRAMGKKKQSEMDQQRAFFEKGAVARGIDSKLATYIFDLMDKFAGYGFNRSHSAAYALVSYQTLWLKTYYPAAFMAAVLSADMDHTDKVVTLIDECRTMGLALEPPKINCSDYRFTIADERTIIYGMGAIKGAGESAIQSIIDVRNIGGVFSDLWDFCGRIDLHKVNRRVLEALIRAGALDEFNANRALLMAQLPFALKAAEQRHARKTAGQVDLFGSQETTITIAPELQLITEKDVNWDDEQRLLGEKETLGLYLTGHPIDRYKTELKAMRCSRIGRLLEMDQDLGRRDRRDREKYTVIGIVNGVRHNKTARGMMGSITLDDGSGQLEITVFSDLYDKYRQLLTPDQLLRIDGTLNFDEFRDAWSLRAETVQTFEAVRLSEADYFMLVLDLSDPVAHAEGMIQITALYNTLTELRTTIGLPIRLHYLRPGAVGDLVLGSSWRIYPADTALKQLRQVFGATAVKLFYKNGAVI